jgi:hypothetical protein
LAASTVGIPSILVTNFTFDSVYSYLSTTLVDAPVSHADDTHPHFNNLIPDIPVPSTELEPLGMTRLRFVSTDLPHVQFTKSMLDTVAHIFYFVCRDIFQFRRLLSTLPFLPPSGWIHSQIDFTAPYLRPWMTCPRPLLSIHQLGTVASLDESLLGK